MRIFFLILFGSIFAAISATILFAVLFLCGAASWVNAHPQTISRAASEAVYITLENGTPLQKKQTLWALTILGTDAQPFVPAIIVTGNEGDQSVLAAARDALMAIDPTATLALYRD
jgi:hypothetical protein